MLLLVRSNLAPTRPERVRLVERRSRVLCRRVMHGSEIQAKYGSSAWEICTFIYPVKYYQPGKYHAPRKYKKKLRGAIANFFLNEFEWVWTAPLYTHRRTCRNDRHRQRPPPAPPMSTPPRPSTMRSDEWPAWFSFWFSGCWRALAKGTAWAFFKVQFIIIIIIIILVWAGACYWYGVGGFVFDSPS